LRIRRVLLALCCTFGLIVVTALPAQAFIITAYGTGGGFVNCGAFYATTDTKVYLTGDSQHYGDPVGVLLQPFQGEIWIDDPGGNPILYWCGPWRWINAASFNNSPDDSVPTGGVCYSFYVPPEWWVYEGCNTIGHWNPYDGISWGSVSWGATMIPSGSGNLSGQTNWTGL
jgi:hypothetical protein